MIYGSVCSGIEAASIAWTSLGWKAAFFSEIEAFPRAVLSHRYPGTPVHGDFTTIERGQYADIDLLVGGTPCQDFSVAGKRQGLDGERGNLTLEFVRLCERLSPRWVVWENVPGVLSIDGGRAFGAFLGALAKLGYGIAYRILDAQFFGVPQRRRRVFVVGHFGNWRPAAAVLFERESLLRGTTPHRKTGKDAARGIENSVRSVSGTLRGSFGKDSGNSIRGLNEQTLIPEIAGCLTTRDAKGPDSDTKPGHLVPVAFDCKAGGNTSFSVGELAGSLRGEGHGGGHAAVAVAIRGGEGGSAIELGGDYAHALRASQGGSDKAYLLHNMAVRRLTPRECERLMGFPDDYTLVPYRGKPAADGPRYKALGNSMAVPVMAWIGRRIAIVNQMEDGE